MGGVNRRKGEMLGMKRNKDVLVVGEELKMGEVEILINIE